MHRLSHLAIALLSIHLWQATIATPSLAQQVAAGDWKRNGLATERFSIMGTGGRNNPLRKPLDSPFTGEELFARFSLRYDAASIDLPTDSSGEFFVLWLDDTEGNDGSGHAGNIPNLGIHVLDEENRFMARFNSSAQKFGPVLQGDRDYLILGRLWKSDPGPDKRFDQLDVWIDPQPGEEFSPDISVQNNQSITKVNWIGFSTGAKTEIDDTIDVWDIRVAGSWRAILDLPSQAADPNLVPGTPRPPKEKTVSFRDEIYPLLEQNCFDCHSGNEAEQGIRLDVVDEVLQRVSPWASHDSHLYQLVAQGKMPPDGFALSEEETELIATWIDEGLDWDAELLPLPIPQSEHWAFQPIERPEIPQVLNQDWPRTPIDSFIAARHEELGLVANPTAETRTLNRRLSLDLHGLPPDTDDLDSPLQIDSLLSSPAYGQHWGRHWLDIARWAESNGHQHNRRRPHAWRYRDWVVDAFNRGKPYDQFLCEQIAGDEMAPFSPEHLVATGFLAAARYSGNELDKRIQRNDILVDIANTTASAFMGLTLECARCHTHKFDPLSIRDYYRFQAFFLSGQPHNIVMSQSEPARDLVRRRWEIFEQVQQRLVNVKRKQGHPEPILVTPSSVVGKMRPGEKQLFRELDQQVAMLDQTWGFFAPSTAATELTAAPHEMRWPLPRDTDLLSRLRAAILIRGDLQSRGPEVSPGPPLVFGRTPEPVSTRLELARWFTTDASHLTARVWVNRLWQWHFGRGLVETGSDFGAQGSPPSHPLLMDYLASELIQHDWDTTHLQHLILDSSTYRLSSQFSAANFEIDPDNRMLWRWSPRRLEAEAIRDSVLAVSGQLDHDAGGPSVNHDSNRRSVYLKQERDNLPAQQILFDSANGIASCSRRRVSTNSLQPLWLMNSQMMQTAAAEFADRAGSVEAAIRIALHRDGSASEVEELKQLEEEFGLQSVCLALMNSSEFLYVP